jgi:hypothetical protein
MTATIASPLSRMLAAAAVKQRVEARYGEAARR